ncbi:MAG: GNAT family N-acetyltransferase [Candidatus Rokubacteria bacterium]|nr:GNAT family N-acetyltransferase [Candidatus Rokubacteria bacterium]
MSAGDRTVRAALPGDAAAIAALVRLAFSTQSRTTDPPPGALKETPATIAGQLARGGGAVLEAGGRIVGAVVWAEEEGGLYLGRLAVHPEHRRQGLARALVTKPRPRCAASPRRLRRADVGPDGTRAPLTAASPPRPASA